MQAGACSCLVPLITSDFRTEQVSQHSPGQPAQKKYCFSVVQSPSAVQALLTINQQCFPHSC